jgi:hypothetical protein
VLKPNKGRSDGGGYDSLVRADVFPFGGEFSSDAQRMPSLRDGNRVGDEGKAVGSAQAPAALLSFHNAMSRSVITITAFAVSRSQKPVQGLRTNSGNFAMFTAIRRARPDVTPDAAPLSREHYETKRAATRAPGISLLPAAHRQ